LKIQGDAFFQLMNLSTSPVGHPLGCAAFMAPVCLRPIFCVRLEMMDSPISEGLTFDDVLLLPGKSSVLPTEVDTTTNFGTPAPSEHPLASRPWTRSPNHAWPSPSRGKGGNGMVPRNMSIDRQARKSTGEALGKRHDR